VKTGIQFLYFVIPILAKAGKTGIHFPLFCHSRVNGNSVHIFIIPCNSFVIPVKTGIQFLHFVIPILAKAGKTGIHSFYLSFPCNYFVIPVQTGIQFIYLLFPAILLSFPSSQKQGKRESILFICHSRENGNPVFTFVI